jgi:hypothetical protein
VFKANYVVFKKGGIRMNEQCMSSVGADTKRVKVLSSEQKAELCVLIRRVQEVLARIKGKGKGV